jgi:hypothetical protein
MGCHRSRPDSITPRFMRARGEATAKQRGLLFPLHQIKPASAARANIWSGRSEKFRLSQSCVAINELEAQRKQCARYFAAAKFIYQGRNGFAFAPCTLVLFLLALMFCNIELHGMRSISAAI